MLNDNELQKIEEKYFVILSGLLEKNIGRMISQIYSQELVLAPAAHGRINVIESAVENIIEAIISAQLQWNVCSLPVSSDSCFECGDSIIHIDAKTVHISDGDSRNNKVNLEASQTTYDCSCVLSVGGRNWQPRLNHYENHRMFGEIPNITFVCKVIYSDDNLVEQIRLISIPHGQLAMLFGNEAILGAGRTVRTDGSYGNIRFLVNEVCRVAGQEWRDRIIYSRG